MRGRSRKTSYALLTGYVSREYAISFFVSFLFFLAIFFVNQILFLARDRLSQSVSLVDTLRLIVYALPAIIALSFPFGSLLGILMTVGKLSADNEMLAMQASGVSLMRLFVPVLALGIGLSGVSFVMNDYFLPLGTLRYTTLYQELLYANSELALSPNTVQQYENTTIITGPSRDGVFQNSLLLDTAEDGKSRVISAAEIRIVRNARQDGVISLDLRGVIIHETDPRYPRDFTVIETDVMVYSILLREITSSVRNPGPREMSSLDVHDLIRNREATLAERWRNDDREIARTMAQVQLLYMQETPSWLRGQRGISSTLERELQLLQDQLNEPRTDRTLQLYKIEFWKKIAIPAACFTFIVLGFPIGLTARHNGRAVGFGFGVLFSVVYWGMLLGAETLGSRYVDVPPALIIFAPNILMVVLGGLLLSARIRR